jgi:hypothetical protein
MNSSKKVSVCIVVLVILAGWMPDNASGENIQVFPFMNVHSWPTQTAPPMGGPGRSVYKQIGDPAEPNEIWSEDVMWYDQVSSPWKSYFESGMGEQHFILSLHNPNPTDFKLDGQVDSRIVVKFYAPDGNQITSADKWWDNDGSPTSDPLINTSSLASYAAWESNSFRISINAGQTVNMPSWGDTNGFFVAPDGESNRRRGGTTMVVTQPDGYHFVATIRGNGIHKYRTSDAEFNSDNYYHLNYVYKGIRLDDYNCPGDEYLLVLPWFREFYSPTNSNADWACSFMVVNAGTQGDVTVSVKDMNGNLIGSHILEDLDTWERTTMMPSQFLTTPSGSFNGRIEVRAEGGAKPVCIGIQHRYQKSGNVRPGGEAYRIPSILACEPFHLMCE